LFKKEGLKMKKIILIVIAGLIIPALLLAQTQHFTFTSNTGDSYSIVIDAATLNGSTLSNGDEIGVFTPADLCVGASVWDGTTPLALTAWINDSQTTEVDGYQNGEAMTFKIWEQSADKEYTATATYTQGNGNFGSGAYAQLTLTAGSAGTESITVVSPNGGETWTIGSEREIQWTSSNFSDPVKIEYSTDGNASKIEIESSTDNDGSYMWMVPNTPSTNCCISISDAADGDPFDISNQVFTIAAESAGGSLIVTNTNDSGPGSLRDAITQANSNPGPDSITFNIPVEDGGYNAGTGVWTITPNSFLPGITDEGLVIDGTTQAEFTGQQTNPSGPEIMLDGSNAGSSASGVNISASGTEILGIAIANFGYDGITISQVQGGRISGCYIGVSADGSDALPNGSNGINMNNTIGFQIGPLDTIPNIICSNILHGIYMVASSHNIFMGNIIGLNSFKNDTLGNGKEGMFMMSECDSNEIFDNYIGGNGQDGICIITGSGNMIANNSIGCNFEQPEKNLGNRSCGIYIEDQSNHVECNTIAHNKVFGVQIYGAQALYNTISRNSIFGNLWAGISNDDGGNNDLTPPSITSISSNSVSGTAPANSTVEIFADANNQGAHYLGSTPSDESGNFNFTGELPPDMNITATATDSEGNTSEFSQAMQTLVNEKNKDQLPQEFRLYQNFPNPFNPVTTIGFSLPLDTFVEINVYSISGQKITTLVNEKMGKGYHNIQFKAENLPSGVYLYCIKTDRFVQVKKMMLLK